MTMTNTRPGSTTEVIGVGLTRTARTTGLLYLGLAVTGALGYQLVRGQLYVPDGASCSWSAERATCSAPSPATCSRTPMSWPGC